MQLPNTLIPVRERPRKDASASAAFGQLFSNGASPDRAKGFTLIEVLIVLAIISFIAIIGIVISLDTYGRYIFRSDADKIIIMLEKARSSAMSNMDQKSYGVAFNDPSDPDDLILFKEVVGTSYDYKVAKNKNATYDLSSCPSGQVIFEQLTGNTTNCELLLTEGDKSVTITINKQGGIDY